MRVTEFYVTPDNEAKHNTIYRKLADGRVVRNAPSPYLIEYLEIQGVFLEKELVEAMSKKEEVEKNEENNIFADDVEVLFE